jgi:FKBP-type peptidyl-prolyl cis-trans isomerase FkpA
MILVLAVGIVLAWAGSRQFGSTASGLRYQMVVEGAGASPTRDDFALVAYKGMLPDGTVFDENPGAPMELSNMVPGFAEAVTLLKKGGNLRVWIPPALAYGANPPPGGTIPANSPLQFEIKLLEFKTRAEVEETQRMMQMQQMMQQQMGGGGAGAPPQGAGAPPEGMQMPEGMPHMDGPPQP